MKFNDTTNQTGLIQECERFCHLGKTGISGASDLLAEFTVKINEANRVIWSWIYNSENGWQYDDGNQTDLPQATTDLVSGTAKYALPTEALTVKRIEILDQNDFWNQLLPITEFELRGKAIDEYFKTDAIPQYYRLLGNTVELFPASDYNATDGFKVYFDRDVVEFVSTDTTKDPGFASIFHRLLAVGASLDWLKINSSNNQAINTLAVDWANAERQVKTFYNKRWNNREPKVLKRAYQSFK